MVNTLFRVLILLSLILTCGCGHTISIRQWNENDYNKVHNERHVIKEGTIYCIFEIRHNR